MDSNGSVTDLGADFIPQAINDNGQVVATTAGGDAVLLTPN